MKTKFFLLITSLMLSFSVWSNNGINNSDTECLKINVQLTIHEQFLKWDFSSITQENSLAVVDFSLTNEGTIKLNEVLTDNPSFKNLVEQNMSKITINTTDINTDLHFQIKLKHSIK